MSSAGSTHCALLVVCQNEETGLSAGRTKPDTGPEPKLREAGPTDGLAGARG